jgi:hypothetical protein
MATASKPGIYDETLVNEVIEVSTEDAYSMVRRSGPVNKDFWWDRVRVQMCLQHESSLAR